MSGRPALIRQREAKQIIEAAKKAGANEVEVRIGEVSVIVHLSSGRKSVEPEGAEKITDLDTWMAEDARQT
jgi:hypothetical protein